MAVRRIPFIIDEYYHVYNRGVDKRVIFSCDRDYNRFMMLLYLCNGVLPVNIRNLSRQGLPLAEIFSTDKGEQLVDIGAYCLMPNHFHLFLHERAENGITMFMEKLSTAYSMYFNKKNERTGSLFEGPFKAKHIDDDPYLNYVFSYIHLNPIKLVDPNWQETGVSNRVSAEKFMKEYKYSSYRDYFADTRPESAILDKKAFPEHFSELNDFNDIINEINLPRATLGNRTN